MDFQEIIERINVGDFDYLEKLENQSIINLLQDSIGISRDPKAYLQKYQDILGDKSHHLQMSEELSSQFNGNLFLFYGNYLKLLTRLGMVSDISLESKMLTQLVSKYNPTTDELTKEELFGLGYFLDKLFHFLWYRGELKQSIMFGNLGIQYYRALNLRNLEFLLRANIVAITTNYQTPQDRLSEYSEILEYFEAQDVKIFSIQLKLIMARLLLEDGEISKSKQMIVQIRRNLQLAQSTEENDFVKDQIEKIKYDLEKLVIDQQFLIGNYDLAIERLEDNLENFKEYHQDNLGYGRRLMILGVIYQYSNDFSNASLNFHRAKQIFEDVGNKYDIADTLFHISLLKIQTSAEDVEQSIESFCALELEFNENKDIKCEYLKTYYHFKSEDLSKKFRSIEGFQKLLQKPISFELEVNITLHLIKVKLIELSIQGREEKKSELEQLISDLIQIVSGKGFYPLEVELVMVKSIFLYYENQFTMVDLLIDEMMVKLATHDMDFLSQRLQNFKHDLQEYVSGKVNRLNNHIFNKLIDGYHNHMQLDIGSSNRTTDQKEGSSKEEIILTQDIQNIIDPTRLSILQLLEKNESLSKSKIRQFTGIPNTTLTRHLNYLVDENVLNSDINFINSRPSKVYQITIHGMNLFNRFKEEILFN